MNVKRLVILSTLLIVIAAGTFAGYRMFYRGQFEFVKPKNGPLTEAIYGLGKVKSENKYEVKLGIMSTVKKIFVQEGDLVQVGDRLIQFTDNLMFRSPIKGTITFVGVHDAESVPPQMTVVRVQDLLNKFIEVSLEQQGALRVKKDQKAFVIFENLRGEKLSGRVKSLFPRQDEFIAHIEVEGLSEQVLPGMTADVAITVSERQDALLIPLSAIFQGHVTIERKNQRIKIPVTIGGIDGHWAEVKNGDLLFDDQILVKKK